MNSKGFTLVELMMTIVILSLLILIAVPSYNGISEAVRKKQRDNKIKYIENAASKYAYDTGKTLIFVDNLVTEGYIDSDDEDGNVIDPLSNKKLNCYVIEMTKQSDYYKASFNENKSYKGADGCNEKELLEDAGELYISVMSNGTTVNTSNWLTGTINLNVYSNTINIDCEQNKCVWSSSSGANIIGKSQIQLDNISGVLNTIYNFQYTVYDEETGDIKRYTTSVNLKIDNQSPTIYENEINVINKLIYTSTKSITITASDNNGSGIVGYYLGLDNGQSCYNSTISYQSSNKFSVSANGNYLICVKDKVGNVSSYKGLEIKYIK